MRSLKEIFFGEPKNQIDRSAHRGIDYMSPPGSDAAQQGEAITKGFADGMAAAGVKEMQDAMAAFDELMLGVKKAAASTDSLTKGAREEIERRAVLHRKAIEKRRKRKRGGHK